MRTGIVTMLLAMTTTTATAAHAQDPATPAPGLARTLAEHRAATIGDVRYDVNLRIPADPTAAIDGALTVRFTLSDASQSLVLDFDPAEPRVAAVTSGGRAVQFELVNGHIVVPASALHTGENEIGIRFTAGDGSLNRNPDFLYTLFVPDRASNARPTISRTFSIEST